MWSSWTQFRDKSAPIAGRSGHDQTAIVSHDRESCFVAAVRWRFGAPESPTHRQGEMKIGEDRGHLMEIARSRCVHAMPPIAKDRDRPCSASDRDHPRRVFDREKSHPSDEAIEL